jgi:hypothetical protein
MSRILEDFANNRQRNGFEAHAYSEGFRPGIPTESGHHSEGSRPLIPTGKRPLFGLSSERWPESIGKFRKSEADPG